MKKLFIPFILLCSLFAGLYSACSHVNVGKVDASVFKKPNYSMFQASARWNRTAGLVLTTTFQKVVLNGTSSLGLNVNTFPLDPAGSGNPLVYYNTTTNVLNFYNLYNVNYICYFTGTTSATLLTTPTDLIWRVTVPNYFGAGNDLHFPNPETAGYSDAGPITYIATRPFDILFPLAVDNIVKTNGAYLEVALSNGTLGTVTLTSATLRIQQTNSTN